MFLNFQQLHSEWTHLLGPPTPLCLQGLYFLAIECWCLICRLIFHSLTCILLRHDREGGDVTFYGNLRLDSQHSSNNYINFFQLPLKPPAYLIPTFSQICILILNITHLAKPSKYTFFFTKKSSTFFQSSKKWIKFNQISRHAIKIFTG